MNYTPVRSESRARVPIIHEYDECQRGSRRTSQSVLGFRRVLLMAPSMQPAVRDYSWEVQPAAWQAVLAWLDRYVEEIPSLGQLRARLLSQTGTRLIDWVDHLGLKTSDVAPSSLEALGFRANTDPTRWHHPGGIFPELVLTDEEQTFPCLGVGLRVDSVDRFLEKHPHLQPIAAQGRATDPLRWAVFRDSARAGFSIVERHGVRGYQAPPPIELEQTDLTEVDHLFRDRPRPWAHEARHAGFLEARQRFARAAERLGRDWACDRFFAAERAYWQSRNRAAQIQFERQNTLGMGWANHDHHTYRSSREHFSTLIDTLERMGFECRERFYAGGQAGWGAQVLEHPTCQLVIFADVDLSPEEVAGDFAHEGLAARQEFGTVGLWCQLHGEAFLSAGMHHLECQFDFDAAREQLDRCGVSSMAPFTDFAFLRQAFTEGENWPIPEDRLRDLVARRILSSAEAERFATSGARGSHLEILQRNEGYKGFNQTGISDIIQRTNPR